MWSFIKKYNPFKEEMFVIVSEHYEAIFATDSEEKAESVAKNHTSLLGKPVYILKATVHNGECQLWATFLNEADAAIKAVKDFAILSLRSKPKI